MINVWDNYHLILVDAFNTTVLSSKVNSSPNRQRTWRLIGWKLVQLKLPLCNDSSMELLAMGSMGTMGGQEVVEIRKGKPTTGKP